MTQQLDGQTGYHWAGEVRGTLHLRAKKADPAVAMGPAQPPIPLAWEVPWNALGLPSEDPYYSATVAPARTDMQSV